MIREVFADFRPRPIPTLIAGTGIVLLLALGTWQVFRLSEKSAINAFRAERVAVAPVPLPARIDDVSPWEFRRVTVTGTFQHDRELHLNARSQRGNTGHQIVTRWCARARRPSWSARGWVPYERKDPAKARRGPGRRPGDGRGHPAHRAAQGLAHAGEQCRAQ